MSDISRCDNVQQFYDQLADKYHQIFADWRSAVVAQGRILDDVIRRYVSKDKLSILDCSCGIGTQAIGLALKGHQVSASDISAKEVERAQAESKSFGVEVAYRQADMRQLAFEVPGQFDAVISCDNALPHLLTDADLNQAVKSMWAKLEPGGLLLVSIRDYDGLGDQKPKLGSTGVFQETDGMRARFQVWEWHDGETYTVHQFLLEQEGRDWATSHYETTYRALKRKTLSELLSQAGFTGIEWLMPEQSGYYQPIVVARKAL